MTKPKYKPIMAKSWLYALQGLWLRLIKAPRQGPRMPLSVAVIRELRAVRGRLAENVTRNSLLYDNLSKREERKREWNRPN